jgi:zinc transporter 7
LSHSKWQAISAQFVTAIAAFAGTFVGLLAERHPVFEDLLLAFTSGGFVYIATIGALPKIVEEESSIVQLIGEVLMFVAGVGLMVLVTFLEEM